MKVIAQYKVIGPDNYDKIIHVIKKIPRDWKQKCAFSLMNTIV